MTSFSGEVDPMFDKLKEIKTEDIYQEIKTEGIYQHEHPLTKLDEDKTSDLHNDDHLEEPTNTQIKNEIIIKNECTDDYFFQGSSDRPSNSCYSDKISSNDILPFERGNSSSSNDPRVRECSVVLFRMPMQEIHQWQNRGSFSKEATRSNADLSSTFGTPQQKRSVQHRNIHAGKKKYVCDFGNCRFKASVRTQLVAHLRTQVSTTHKYYICDFCDFKTKSCQELVTHSKDEHRGRDLPFSCSICKYWAGDRLKLMIHMRKHEGLPGPKSVESTSPPHRKTTKPEKMESQASPRPVALSSKVKPGPEKTWKCKFCTFDTAARNEFTVHMTGHAGLPGPKSVESTSPPHRKTTKPEKMESQASPRPVALSSKVKPGPEKTWKCKFCTFDTAARNEFTVHMTGHADEEFYICGLCDFVTYDRDCINPHKWKHVGQQTENKTCDAVASEDILHQMRSCSPSLESSTSSAATAVEYRTSLDNDELRAAEGSVDMSLIDSEVQYTSEAESDASDAGVKFL